MDKVSVLSDYAEICQTGADQFVQIVTAAADRGRRAAVALSGGSSPRGLYQLLATDVYRRQVPWSHVHFFWGDERCVPPDHADSNYRMAREALLSHLEIDDSQVHRMPAEASDLEAATRQYEDEIRRVLGEAPRFDLIHLGMGDDGHTASLFPHTAALGEQTRLVVPNHVDKLNTNRLTFTYPLINAAHQVTFLVTGAAKAQILRQVLRGPRDDQRLPSQAVQPAPGRLTWLVDAAAATNLG